MKLSIKKADARKLDLIVDIICHHFQIEPKELFAISRKRAIIAARQHFHYLARLCTTISLETIGVYSEKYGNPFDHSTVLHSHRQIEKYKSAYKKEREDIEALELIASEALFNNHFDKDFSEYKKDLLEKVNSTISYHSLLKIMRQHLYTLSNV
ncbi:helix-turn-helix domain-containing protein [Leeuwenhoekiella sp. MAR_2009_132]|uniref:helix-turn-helix domain-containing protein n=1 Tax=Leeuwenhoekiella sp. MAR_2009_132 TaxID=1392489 RepID=UPI00048A6FFA|nr:helix-turn-helix domain-containing protein [Leeuwenhoekiella sp. MAR_2009_132]